MKCPECARGGRMRGVRTPAGVIRMCGLCEDVLLGYGGDIKRFRAARNPRRRRPHTRTGNQRRGNWY